MAYIQSAAILTRIREVVEDSAGSLRVVPSSRFVGDLPEGLSNEAEAFRAVTAPRVEASIVAIRRSPSSPGIMGNLLIYELDIQIKLIRLVEPIAQIDDDSRVALQGLALADADVLAQALEFPGNLTQTAASAVTDLASGCLRYIETTLVTVGDIDNGSQQIETTHIFRGIAISRPATS